LNTLLTSTTSLKRKPDIYPSQKEQSTFDFYTFSFVFHYFCFLPVVTFVS
jgi:hypothetical protein